MKELILLVGSSGSGKSTIRKKLVEANPELQVYSWDELRIEFAVSNYPDFRAIECSIERAEVAYEFTLKEHGFQNFLTKRFNELLSKGSVLVDNTNTSVKRRAMFVEAARAKNYKVSAYIFPISREELLRRAKMRTDHKIPTESIMQQYNSIQYPGYGEVDEIYFVRQGIIE